MSEQNTVEAMSAEPTCRHRFDRRKGWWLHRVSWMRWVCITCGYTTRTYDGIDRVMTRPIHPHMSVAFPGYNTIGPGGNT